MESHSISEGQSLAPGYSAQRDQRIQNDEQNKIDQQKVNIQQQQLQLQQHQQATNQKLMIGGLVIAGIFVIAVVIYLMRKTFKSKSN